MNTRIIFWKLQTDKKKFQLQEKSPGFSKLLEKNIQDGKIARRKFLEVLTTGTKLEC